MKDIKVHSAITASIKDLSKDLEITDTYWNSLFESLVTLFDAIYFRGFRRWVQDEEFEQTLTYVAEEVLIDEGKEHSDILFRVKTSYMMHNRTLISKMWSYYDFPGFIFLGDIDDENALLAAYNNRSFDSEIIEQISNVLIMYRQAQPDVLWLCSNVDLQNILSFI